MSNLRDKPQEILARRKGGRMGGVMIGLDEELQILKDAHEAIDLLKDKTEKLGAALREERRENARLRAKLEAVLDAPNAA